MAGGIYHRGKIWWAWWTAPVKDPKTGKLRQKKYYASSQSTRRADAVTLLSTKIHEARTQKPRLDIPDPTYEEVRDLWIASKPGLPKHRDGTPYFQGRTHLDAFFSGRKAKDIDIDDFVKLEEVLRGKGLNASGINHVMVSLRTMLRYAVQLKRLQPFQLPSHFPMLKVTRRKPEPFDDAAFKLICAQLPELFRGGFTLSYHSGMRLSEVERLTWNQVKLPKRRLEIISAKTDDERMVPLLGGADKLLAKMAKTKASGLVFPGFADRTARARAWRIAVVKAGLGGWHCRRCDAPLAEFKCAEHGELDERTAKFRGPLMRYTRTTFIKNATNAGIPLSQIMNATGHKSLTMHMSYNTQTDEDLEAMREKYDG